MVIILSSVLVTILLYVHFCVSLFIRVAFVFLVSCYVVLNFNSFLYFVSLVIFSSTSSFVITLIAFSFLHSPAVSSCLDYPQWVSVCIASLSFCPLSEDLFVISVFCVCYMFLSQSLDLEVKCHFRS